jgi:hypothetical protein
MKEKLTKIAETIGMIIVLGFGLFILSMGFRFLFEAARTIFKH